jgi:thiol:disulfide interchange protein DsbD
MGFVLLGTVIYLLSMLEQAKIFVLLSALLTLAFSAWLWARPIAGDKSRITLGRILALVLLVPALYFPFTQRVADTSWKNFNASAFQAEIGKRNLLIDFTADWCINCRAMELTTLSEQRLKRWAEAYGLTFIKVDLTGRNPHGEELLHAMGSASIPLIAIIPANAPGNPTVLRDLVTPAQLDSALKRVFKNH